MVTTLSRRTRALVALTAVALLGAGLAALPVAAKRIPGSSSPFRSIRARFHGARYLGRDGVVLQRKANDCGPACLKMVLDDRGIVTNLEALEAGIQTTPGGTSLLTLRLAAGRVGLPGRSWLLDSTSLQTAPKPLIAFVRGNHFVVIRKLLTPDILVVDDPALGRLSWPIPQFLREWSGEALVFNSAWTPGSITLDALFPRETTSTERSHDP